MGAPAIVKVASGPYIYLEGAADVAVQEQTGKVVSAMHGQLAEFPTAIKAVIKGRAVGMITTALLSSIIPLGVSIGGSCMAGTVVMWTRDGYKTTWTRGGITGSQELMFSPIAQLFGGDLEITCLGNALVGEPTDPAFWNAITSAAMNDATFDETKIKRYQYRAAYGTDAPYDEMLAQEGFKVTVMRETVEVPSANFGIRDIELTSLFAKVSFIPENLTEAEAYTLCKLQNTGARLIGQNIAGADDLVIAGSDAASGFSVTVNKPGFHAPNLTYQPGKLRVQEIEAVPTRTFTAGVADPLLTFEVT